MIEIFWILIGSVITFILFMVGLAIDREEKERKEYFKSVNKEFWTLEKRVCDLECKIATIPKKK